MQLGPKQLELVEALESGEYYQCTGRLVKECYEGRAYCCLGVACLLNGGFERGFDTSGSPLVPVNSKIINYWYLSDKVRDALAFYDIEGGYSEDVLAMLSYSRQEQFRYMMETNNSLDELNDSGQSFKYIARVLREFPELFFRESR